GAGVEPVRGLAPPDRDRPLPVAHAGPAGAGDDLLGASEVVAAVREPGIDDVRLADVLQADGTVGFPALRPDAEAAAHRGTAIHAVHRSAVADALLSRVLPELL